MELKILSGVCIVLVLVICYLLHTRKKQDWFPSTFQEADYMYKQVREAYSSTAIRTDNERKASEAAYAAYASFSSQFPENPLIKDFDLAKMIEKLHYHYFEVGYVDKRNTTGNGPDFDAAFAWTDAQRSDS